MNLIVFASTSGSTEAVVEELLRQLPNSSAVDLKGLSSTTAEILVNAEFVFAGSPTYGKGDWHYLWQEKFSIVVPILSTARSLSLFGLGDARFHGATFCGGLGRLFDAAHGAGLSPVGTTPADVYSYMSSPALRDGRFPGYVIDYKQDRRVVSTKVSGWLCSLAQGGHLRRP